MNTSRNKKIITPAGKYNSDIGLYSFMLHITRVGIAIIKSNPKISSIMTTLYCILMIK